VSADTLSINAIGQTFLEEFWKETIITLAPVEIEQHSYCSATITRQYIYTADNKGNLSHYEIEDSRSWNSSED
jgi:hypothetical protein